MALTRNASLQILGLSSGASEDEIKKAYRKLAMKYHPDRNSGATAEAEFKRVKEAYETLTEGPQRHKYNESDFNSFDWAPSKNGDKVLLFTSHIPISLTEAFFGKTAVVNFAPLGPTNFGIAIPPGQMPDSRVKIISSKAENGTEVQVDVRVSIHADEWTVRWATTPNLYGGGIEGSGDMEKTIHIDWLLAVRGGNFVFDTIDGATLQLRIIPGIESGTRLKVKGRGYWKDSNCTARGDVYLRVVPKVQKFEDMSIEQLEEMIKELKNTLVKKRDPFHDAAKREHVV